ncbi:YybH family protein [Candidatus Palauibacter sp.]|uniref:YybH family protein n=1 Tax=Candidatus Palauibacter sp. TaxID=3101350 RepID=UPI003AF24240
MRIRTLAPLALALTVACGEPATDDAAMTDDMAEAMPDAEAAMTEITDYWQTHFNMGHGSMVASKYAEDAILWGSSGAMLYGREAIGAGLQARIDAEGSQIAIHPGETMGFGDQLVARGHYVLTGEVDGRAATNSGYYMALADNTDGEWSLKGMVSNLDTPDQTMSAGEMMEQTEGMGGDLIQASGDYFVTHYNMGHASMVADTYTEDAVAMMAGEPAREGRAAVEEGLQAMFDAGVTFTGMTAWSAHDLDEGHVAGVGTYGTEGPDGAGGGHFAALYARGEDGSLMLHWLLTGAHPGM